MLACEGRSNCYGNHATFGGTTLKTNEANKPLVNVVPLEGKTEAAGSEKGQQLIPAITGIIFWVLIQ